MVNYLTQKDVEDYGSELIGVSQRAAIDAVAPYLESLRSTGAAGA
jgi:hypothetical protein